MLNLLKIFVITGICSFFIINNTVAQDKKLFDNLGVYFSPMLDYYDPYQSMSIITKADEAKLYVDGYTLGLRSNIDLNNIFYINYGIGYGQLFNMSFPKGFPKLNENISTGPVESLGLYLQESKLIRTDIHLRINILSNNNKQFYFSMGSFFLTNIYEKYYELFDCWNVFMPDNTETYVIVSPRLYNVIAATGFGLNYTINPKLSIDIEINYGAPIWKNQNKLFTKSSQELFNEHFYKMYFSINIGLIYKW